MAWIRTVAPEEAKGRLARLYAQAVRRAGKVFQVIRLQSLHPHVLAATTDVYLAVMYAPGRLTRVQRELLATAVSRENGCHY
jgi:alkylhydroperoxidase family enzyme